MGTEIDLKLGNLPVDWGKNYGFQNHSVLFNHNDLTEVPYFYADDVVEYKEGYSTQLSNVVGRLELMGYTVASAKAEYLGICEFNGDEEPPVPFDELKDAIAGINVSEVTGKWTKRDRNQPQFVPKKILANLGHGEFFEGGKNPDYWDIEVLLSRLSAYSKLRLFAENPNNLQQPVIWGFTDLVESGWTTREAVMAPLSAEQKFLIVTEGSSDSKILQKALELLKPAIMDFFKFIDMEEGYPFSGTGNLYRFCQGLVSIGVLNRVLVIYDNDAEGVSKLEVTKKLALPHNMIAIKLPDIEKLARFPTIGPSGEAVEDINGKAAAIECYLDLEHPKLARTPRVRWSSYVEALDCYQGALEGKTAYAKAFLSLRSPSSSYDFSKIIPVLESIYAECVSMSVATTSRETFELP
jgi:hypothetical protein